MALYKQYDDETLAKLQKAELIMLQDFCDLCEQNDITYFLIGGSAIGAVRHGGFIPWDDDIDIAFDRENFEKFFKIASNLDKYYLLNTRNDKNYPLMTTRMCRKGTVFREETFKDLPCDLGIFLDLFCFDAVPDDDKKMKLQGWNAWFWNKLQILKSTGHPTLYFGGWKAKLTYFICGIAHFGLNFLHISPKWLYDMGQKAARKYEGQKTKRIAHFFEPTPFCSIVNVDDIFPVKKMSYNGVMVDVPGNIDRYLTIRYGDYMKLPPEEKRHNHPPYQLDFGDLFDDVQ